MRRLLLMAAVGALPAAAMAAPVMEGFASAAAKGDVVQLRGIGWGQKGRFNLPSLGASGTFRRSAERVGVGMVDYVGGVDFTFERKGGAIAGRCRYHQGTSEWRDRIARNVRVETSVLEAPFSYRCEFLQEGRAIGSLTLDRAPGRPVDLRTLRAGEVEVSGARLTLRSVHTFAGSKLPTETPLGYTIIGSQGTVGAAYLNGGSRRLVLPKTGAEREAALLASLALALLWDPGDGD